MDQTETKLVRGWRTKIGLLLAIITPTVAVTGSFYSIKLDAQDRDAKMVERISTLETNSNRVFADKADLQPLREDITHMRDEISDIKTILIRQHR